LLITIEFHFRVLQINFAAIQICFGRSQRGFNLIDIVFGLLNAYLLSDNINLTDSYACFVDLTL